MKKLLFLLSIFLIPYFSFAQVDMGLPGSTGMGGVANGVAKDWECIGINPANLGWKNNYRFSISTLIFGISAQSSALDYSQLKNAILHPTDTFSAADKKMYADLFSNADGLNLSSNLTWLTFSFTLPKVGGFAMNLRDRTFGHVKLNENLSDILFMGTSAPIFKDTAAFAKNISNVFNGSKIGFLHYRELNLSYGTKIIGFGGTADSSAVSLYGGVGMKILWGLGNLDVQAENNLLSGHSSFASKYGINYGSIKNFTPEETQGIFSGVGNGTAFDLGAGIEIKKLKITVSAVDMGSINWNKNNLIASDTLLPDTTQFNYHGLTSWGFAKQAGEMFNDSGLVKFKPGDSYKTNLPSKLRIGMGYQLSPRMIIGADLVAPLNDNTANLQKAFIALGTEVTLASNLKINFGLAGNSTYGFAVPFGITLGRFFSICELRLATGNILTHLGAGKNPNISLSFSLLRFNLEKKK